MGITTLRLTKEKLQLNFLDCNNINNWIDTCQTRLRNFDKIVYYIQYETNDGEVCNLSNTTDWGATYVDNVYEDGVGRIYFESIPTTIPSMSIRFSTNLTKLTITDNFTSIGDCALEGCTSLSSITIPSSVTSIGEYAFSGCTSLSSVNLPNSITELSDFLFCNCKSLSSITIPESVTSIGNDVFAYCSSLTSVTIPNSVTKIGIFAFENCDNLKNVALGTNLTRVDTYAFYHCSSLAQIVSFANEVPDVDNTAFYGVGRNGLLTYLEGMDYSSWLYTSQYYLGYYGWTGSAVTPTYSSVTTTSCEGYDYTTTVTTYFTIDGGTTWYYKDAESTTEHYSTHCGYVPPERDISGDTYCGDKATLYQYIHHQISYDDGATWETVSTTSKAKRYNSYDCGYRTKTESGDTICGSLTDPYQFPLTIEEASGDWTQDEYKFRLEDNLSQKTYEEVITFYTTKIGEIQFDIVQEPCNPYHSLRISEIYTGDTYENIAYSSSSSGDTAVTIPYTTTGEAKVSILYTKSSSCSSSDKDYISVALTNLIYDTAPYSKLVPYTHYYSYDSGTTWNKQYTENAYYTQDDLPYYKDNEGKVRWTVSPDCLPQYSILYTLKPFEDVWNDSSMYQVIEYGSEEVREIATSVTLEEYETAYIGSDIRVLHRSFRDNDKLRYIIFDKNAANVDIYSDAFYHCTSLEIIVLPLHCYISITTFMYCYGLKTIVYQGTKAQWNNNDYAYKDTDWNLSIHNSNEITIYCTDGNLDVNGNDKE